MASQSDSNADSSSDSGIVNAAVAQGGAYDVIRQRLVQQSQSLREGARALNTERATEFGASEMQIKARVRVRTENNCVARDIVQVGELILFGYNVFIGLRQDIRVDDVFALFRETPADDAHELTSVPMTGTFLDDPGFRNDFDELYRYYKNTFLVQLAVAGGHLLAGFQTSDRVEDLRVFRWSVSPDGKTVSYIDNRGERELKLPPRYGFEWTEATRDNMVEGRFPHVNILDTVFVNTLGGNLTLKVEDNTEDGLGVYNEPVEESNQSITDAQFQYASVGTLILLRILPYGESAWRYLVFNTLDSSVQRLDAIGLSCVELPEDHGILFPGGYYLNSGEFKTFDDDVGRLRYKRMIRSPNGEDVLYVFYDRHEGKIGLFGYNLIEKTLHNPLLGHGYALSEDGRLIIFVSDDEPTRVHPMEIWQTPYCSDEFASRQEPSRTFLGRIGNPALVRGISDLLSISRLIDKPEVSLRVYEELNAATRKIFDAHYWLDSPETRELHDLLTEIRATSELVIDEFEKVSSIRAESAKTMQVAEVAQEELLRAVQHTEMKSAQEYVDALGRLRRQRGHLTTIREYRYIDLERIDTLDRELGESEGQLAQRTVDFLSAENALSPYLDDVRAVTDEIQASTTVAELSPLLESLDRTSEGLDLLSELIATLKVSDATVRVRIVDSISEVYGAVNQAKAQGRNRRSSLGSAEAVAEFSAQFKLFSQSINNALGMSTTPERCEEQLSRLLVQLEELESQFADHDVFLADIVTKREEIYEAFEAHRQQLVDARQRRSQATADAATRILSSIEKRSLKFTQEDDLNTYFASDAMVSKVRDLARQLRELDAAVQADDIDSRMKAIRAQSVRSLRDKSDLFEEGGNVIKFGPRHRFSVNTQELDLTIIPRNDVLAVHLTGTDFYEDIERPELLELRRVWDMTIPSETPAIYRGEFLAGEILADAIGPQREITHERLRSSIEDEVALGKLVRDYAAPRYREGYERGIHDHDAAALLRALAPMLDSADLLRFDPASRGLAQVFWANVKDRDCADSLAPPVKSWAERAQSASQLHSSLASTRAQSLLATDIGAALDEFLVAHPVPAPVHVRRRAAEYLVAELGREHPQFIVSKYARQLLEELKRSLEDGVWRKYQAALKKLHGWPAERFNMTRAWLDALVASKSLDRLERFVPEAVALINAEQRLERRESEVDLQCSVSGLLGQHPHIRDGAMSLTLDEFLIRHAFHRDTEIPNYERFQALRHEVINKERNRLRIDELRPRPLSSFVRNRLINEVYLPLIGDNLAKQIGTVGEDKRSDLMGLLMMISPPGYGKTTLMEYVANRLGLIFMKINCPSLGHDVVSLDPEQAPNATARQELVKINLSFEMGNNVMLYLDDIQHTHPEFLQKFISLCDGTRRVEGVWKGRTRTYDMRGRKFCVVMAGNPYTESGEMFKVPDMLANRADIYNLGDILGGREEQFALSYVENALTSNAVLAPLAMRDMHDVYRFVKLAQGDDVPSTDFSHHYSGAEANEITGILEKMFAIRDVVLKINQQYIASAAQDDRYREEPPFKLQGSYRNMNKMVEKISPVLSDDELMQIIADHYLGEAQLLTTGAEANLLKLAELRGNMTGEQKTRWEDIRRDFLRNKAMGGDDADIGGRVVVQLMELVGGVEELKKVALQVGRANARSRTGAAKDVEALAQGFQRVGEMIAASPPSVNVVNQPVPGMDKVLQILADTIENSFMPLVRHMDRKLEVDLGVHYRIEEIAKEIHELRATLRSRGQS